MKEFLPISQEDINARGWEQIDFLFISGDAYVDHPSFGPAVICRVLEAQGYKVALLCQPDWRKLKNFEVLGKPRLAVLISGGNLDSMLCHTANLSTGAVTAKGDDTDLIPLKEEGNSYKALGFGLLSS